MLIKSEHGDFSICVQYRSGKSPVIRLARSIRGHEKYLIINHASEVRAIADALHDHAEEIDFWMALNYRDNKETIE